MATHKISVGLDFGNCGVKVCVSHQFGRVVKIYTLSASKSYDEGDSGHLGKKRSSGTVVLPHRRHIGETAAGMSAYTITRKATKHPEHPHVESLLIGSILAGIPETFTDIEVYMTTGIAINEEAFGQSFVAHYSGKNYKGQLRNGPEVNILFKSVDWDFQPVWAVLRQSLKYNVGKSLIEEDLSVGESHYLVVDGGSKQINTCEILPGFTIGDGDSARIGTWQYLKRFRKALTSLHKIEYTDFAVMKALTTGILKVGEEEYNVRDVFAPIVKEYAEGAVNLADNTVVQWSAIDRILIQGGMALFLLPAFQENFGGHVGKEAITVVSDPLFCMAESMELSARYDLIRINEG